MSESYGGKRWCGIVYAFAQQGGTPKGVRHPPEQPGFLVPAGTREIIVCPVFPAELMVAETVAAFALEVAPSQSGPWVSRVASSAFGDTEGIVAASNVDGDFPTNTTVSFILDSGTNPSITYSLPESQQVAYVRGWAIVADGNNGNTAVPVQIVLGAQQFDSEGNAVPTIADWPR